jgi:formylglycine-generating enzyme required for sulfatase activity
MRITTLALTAMAMAAAGCGGGGDSYTPPPDNRPDPPPPTAASVRLDLATGRLLDGAAELPGDATSLSLRRISSGTVAVAALDAVVADGSPAATRSVTVAAGWIATTELTRAQWRTLVDRTGAGVPREPWSVLPAEYLGGSGDAAPATNLAWTDISAVLAAWNATQPYRLAVPDGARWEAAALAGGAGPWPWGADPALASTYAVVGPASATGPAAVGGRPAAANGLRDCAGNAWEWVTDGGPENGPVLRGGSWSDPLLSAQAGNRLDCPPGVRHPTAGVRLLLETP